jgi:hypothetical protein
VAFPDWAVFRIPLVGYPGAAVTFQFDEGPYCHFQACDWFLIEGREGTAPDVQVSTSTTNRASISVTHTALQQQSLVLAAGAQGAPSSVSAFNRLSTNLTRIRSGNTNGLDENTVPDTNAYKNQVYGVGQGVAPSTADFTSLIEFTGANAKCSICSVAYKPKTVIGAGQVELKLEGGRDTLSVPYGVMELWFMPDGKTVHVRTPKP